MGRAQLKAWTLCVLAALLVSVVSAEVKVATAANFDEVIRATDVAFVKFYAPWCGHCKALKPNFEEAADTLKDTATLAEVDCTVEKELAERFSVKGFPTLIIFRGGQEVDMYEGPRDAKSLVQYVKSQIGPAVHNIATADELDALKKEDMPLCLVKTAKADSPLAQLVSSLADKMRSSYIFALVTDAAIAPEAAMESITVHRSDDEMETFVPEKADELPSSEALEEFLQIALTPFLGEINAQTFRSYMVARPVGWLFMDKNCDESLKTSLREVAKKYRQKLLLCWINADMYGAVGQQMALPTDVKYPAFVIESQKKHHIQPQEPAISAESTSKFIDDFLAGKVKPTVMSQEIPEVETERGLTVLVGKSLPQKMKENKDILVFFYAPWCQHCKNLHPIYEKLAMEMQAPNLIIGKFDITTNNFDPDLFEVSGIPTLYFIPAGKKPIPYSGQRTQEGLTAFIEKHRTKFTGAGFDAEAPSADAAAETATTDKATEAGKESTEGDL